MSLLTKGLSPINEVKLHKINTFVKEFVNSFLLSSCPLYADSTVLYNSSRCFRSYPIIFQCLALITSMNVRFSLTDLNRSLFTFIYIQLIFSIHLQLHISEASNIFFSIYFMSHISHPYCYAPHIRFCQSLFDIEMYLF